jgi:hypothetical protein
VPRPKSPQRLARRAARMPRLPRRLPIGRPRPARRANHQQWRRRQRRRSPPRFRRRSCRISWCVQLRARASGPPMKDSLWNSVRFVPGAVFSVREQSELVFYRQFARRDRLPMWSSRALLRRHRRRRCLQRVSIPAREWNARPAPCTHVFRPGSYGCCMTRCALYVVARTHTDSASCGHTHTDSASCSYGFVEFSLRGGAEACKRTLDNSIAPSPLSPAFTQISTVYPSMIGRSVALLPVSRARAMATHTG